MSSRDDVSIEKQDSQAAHRLKRFLRSHNPRDLWPSLELASYERARLEIQRATAALLAGQSAVELRLRNEAAYALTIAAFTTGMGALLGRWIEDGRLSCAESLRGILARELDAGRRRAARIQRDVQPALHAMLAQGITPVLLKGAHTAHAYWDEPGLRPSADVDVWVPHERLRDTEDALRAVGYVAGPTAQPPFRRHWRPPDYPARVNTLDGIDADGPWEIDVHTSFNRSFAAGQMANLDDVSTATVPLHVASVRIAAPAQPLALLLLACHCSTELQSMRLMRLVELHRVIQADLAAGSLDWQDVARAVTRAKLGRYVYPALALVERLVPETVEPSVLALCRRDASWLIRHTVERMVPVGLAIDRRSVAARLLWARDPFDAVRIAYDQVARVIAKGPTEVLAVSRALIRRAVSGALSLRPVDERTFDASTPPPHPARGRTISAGHAEQA